MFKIIFKRIISEFESAIIRWACVNEPDGHFGWRTWM